MNAATKASTRLNFGKFVRTKLVATFGPACSQEAVLTDIIADGVDVFRLNMAHGSRDEHANALTLIRKTASACGQTVAVLVDLAGPKIRLGTVTNDAVNCHDGDLAKFVRNGLSDDPLAFTTTYPRLIDELDVDDRIMLADGTVSMVVTDKKDDSLICRVVQGGLLRSRQGVNLPGAKLSVPALSRKDRDDATWAASAEVDFVGLSFVRKSDEVHELKQLLRSHHSNAHVIAKIEKQEALDNLEGVIEAADAIMVARGDLGVEIDVARVPVAQKHIVASCNRLGKPVIIATQMLDSMQHSRWPTRAEATDVANAILDGADACMLSAESAIGDNPREAVRMLQRIAHYTEEAYRDRIVTAATSKPAENIHPVTQAVVFGAGQIATKLDAKLMVVASHSGATVLASSKRRGFVPIVGLSDNLESLRKMCLYWGVTPIADAPAQFLPDLLAFVDHWGRKYAGLETGDRVVVVTGSGLIAHGHNIVVVHEMSDD